MTAEAHSIKNFSSYVAYMENSITNNKASTLNQIQNGRIAFIAASILSGVSGLVLTSVACISAPVTYGLSTALLFPAAACYLVCFETFKVVRISDILIERASKSGLDEVLTSGSDKLHTLASGLPEWAKRVKAEIDQTIIYSRLLPAGFFDTCTQNKGG